MHLQTLTSCTRLVAMTEIEPIQTLVQVHVLHVSVRMQKVIATYKCSTMSQ